ncbi:MAG: SixA phosphatase family protein [Flavobacteriaceae bacterium]
MKKLILIRHAKSSWESQLKDLERPLSKRGINDSKIMSDVVNNVCKEVEIVFCSVARRASETCNIFMKNITQKKKIKVIYSENLYDFSGNKVDEFIKKINNKLNSVMIFSHNNTCTNLLLKYSKDQTHVPTCGVLIFNFDVSLWSEINFGICQKYFPKDYR